jgi:histidine ammonia-lyase
MIRSSHPCGRAQPWAAAVGILLFSPWASFADGEGVYHAINPSMVDENITLTGHDLTIDQVIQVARYGAKVQLSPEAKQRETDNYGLLLEAATEDVPVYWFNRGAGTNRQVHLFDGDPLDPNNKMKDGRTVKEYLEQTLLEWFKDGAYAGDPPEILDEDLVRAVMVVRANAMTFDAPSPQVSQVLIDMLNKRITPVMMARASTGSTDMEQTEAIAAPMVGAGDCYYHGRKMPSKQALRQAGLRPIQPFGADDNELTSSNSYSTAVAAFIVFEGEQALQWADLTYAIDLNGMNSPTAPLSYLVQTNRPFKWVNWDANRVKEMLRGSYLFDADLKRVIQDPESIRAAPIRQGTAWQMWAHLRDDVVTQLNSSDHNPAIRAGLSAQASWDLQTPEMQRYFVKGGKNSNGMFGFILANANWDPFPIAIDLEAFTLALADLDLTLMLRIERFGNPFFTQVDDEDPLASLSRGDEGFIGYEVWQDIQALLAPVMPEGYGGNTSENEELESQTRIRAQHARAVVDDTFRLLSDDLLNGARWLDLRKEQDRSRTFGPGPTAAWEAFRKVVPSHRTPLNGYGDIPKRGRDGEVAYKFLKANPASTFVPLKEVEVGKF